MTAEARPAPAAAARPSWLRQNRIPLSILSILVLLYAVFLAGNPAVFTSFDIYRSLMSTLPFFGIMALAATFIVTLGEIDLSFPSVMGLSSWVFGTVFLGTGSFALALVACLATGAAAGLGNGLLVTRIGIPSIVATIGTMFLWRGLVTILAQGKGVALVELRASPAQPLFVGRLFGEIPMQFVWFLALAVLLGLVYRRHWFGSHVLFVGDNRESARMMGINVDGVKVACFMLLGAAAALAGVFQLCELTYFFSTQGEGYLLTTLAAVFIGGTSVFGGKGTMFGTVVGVLIMASLESGIVAIGLTGFWVQFLSGVLIVASVSLYALMMRR